jgi:hypothetical protein
MNHVNSDDFCPVCGYDGLEDGTALGEICSSCGTEFGYSDFKRSHEQLRQLWINQKLARWWSQYTPKPANWSAQNQLRNICTPDEIRELLSSLVNDKSPIEFSSMPQLSITHASSSSSHSIRIVRIIRFNPLGRTSAVSG